MRLSESLRRGIMKSTVGGIINKFKVGTSRRDTLFFEELLAEYIYECEKKGFGEETRKMGEEWGFLIAKALAPEAAKKMPPSILFNVVLRHVWHNLGLLDDLHTESDGKRILLRTKNEFITRIIGKSNFSMGFYKGILNVMLDCGVIPVSMEQNKEGCTYVFETTDEKTAFLHKDKKIYDRLNSPLKIEGFTLKAALSKKIFNLDEHNMIRFKGKLVSPVENTLFHIISNKALYLDRVSRISYNYFHNIVSEDSNQKQKLTLLKNILQVMGWGKVKIIASKGSIMFEIKDPPYGLQAEKDNWDFIVRTIEGYLWLINKKFKVYDKKYIYKKIVAVYK